MIEDYENFDILKKGFLTYNEYCCLCFSYFIKPKTKNEIGDVIFKQDLYSNHEKDNLKNEKDYMELFNFCAEDGNITYDSLQKAISLLKLEFDKEDLTDMILFVNSLNEKIDYVSFCKLMNLL